MAQTDGMTRTFYVKNVGVTGKHDTPTVTMENGGKTEKIKIVFEDKKALRDFNVDDEFVFVGRKASS